MTEVTYPVITEILQAEEIQAALRFFKEDLPSLQSGMVSIPEFSNKILSCGHLCVLREDDIVKGFAVYYDNDTQSFTAYLSMIAVKPGYRHEHIGTRILGFVESEAVKSGMKFLKLEVGKKNLTGQKFYRRLGYEQCGEKSQSWYYIKNLGES